MSDDPAKDVLDEMVADTLRMARRYDQRVAVNRTEPGPGQNKLEAMDARAEREEAEAEHFHDQEPGRWGDHASPARMRRDRERDAEEDER